MAGVWVCVSCILWMGGFLSFLYLVEWVWDCILPVSGGVGIGLYPSCIWWSRWMGGFLSFLFLVEWVWVCIHPAFGGVGVGLYPSCFW